MTEEHDDAVTVESNSVLSDDPFALMPDSDHVSLVHELPSRPVDYESATMVNAETVEPKLGPRRFSTGNIAIPYSKVKILSRYLAASTGSCHDNCKYGSKEAPQELPKKSPILKRAQQSQGMEKYARALSSSFKSLKPNIPAAVKKIGVSANGSSNPVLRRTQSKPVYLTGTGCSIGIKDGDVTGKEVMRSFSTSLKGKTEVRGCSGGKKDGNIVPEKEVMRFFATSLHGASSSKEKTGVRGSKRTSTQDEKKHSLRPTASLSARHPVKKVLTRSTYSLSPKRSAKLVSRMKSNPESLKNLTRVSRGQNDVRKAECEQHSCTNVSEKVLHVDVVEPNAKEVYRKPKSKTRLEKGGVSPARNLSFRAGKVVELPSECTSSRRLKYGERVLHDAQIDKAENAEVILKETEVDIHESDDAPETEAGKVILKHQEVKGKKRERRLLNNMIKETATKLSASRKSKVKALVGAFETVISLQESKKLATVEAC